MSPLENFKRGESKLFYDSLSSHEKQEIEDFIKYVSITSKSSKRLNNNRRSLLTFRKSVDKNLSHIELNDLRNFLSLLNNSNRTQSSRNEIKHTIKRFLRWKFKDWSKRFEDLSDIKLVMRINEEKINAETLLSKEDVEAIVKAEPKLIWKAFFLTLYESGLRPKELRTLLWKNITFNIGAEGLSEINVYATKTSRSRSVYIKEATFYLQRLKENSISDLVFPSPRDPLKCISKELPSIWLSRISQKVLGRKVYPYILRHSRATELYTNSNIPDKAAQKFLGHSKSMSEVYTHLSNKDVREAVSRSIYQTEDLPPEKKHKLEIEVETLKSQMRHALDLLNKVLDKKSLT